MTTVNIEKKYHLIAQSLISPTHPSIKAVVEAAIDKYKDAFYDRPKLEDSA